MGSWKRKQKGISSSEFRLVECDRRKFNSNKHIFAIVASCQHSGIMRQWLWKDTLNNVGMYHSQWLVVHAIGSVWAIYVTCVLLDLLRITLIERKAMAYLDEILDK